MKKRSLVEIAEDAVKASLSECIGSGRDDKIRYLTAYAAESTLEAVFAPENRAALLDALVEDGIIEEQEVWLPPDEITDEMIDKARRQVENAKGLVACGSEFGGEELNEATGDLLALLGARRKWRLYDADDRLPAGAVPLYRVNRGES